MHRTSREAVASLAVYLFIPLLFIAVPVSYLESHSSICLIKVIFGVECPGCGMLRAIACAFHGEMARAYRYNPLVVIVFPLLCLVWLKGVAVEWRRLFQACGEPKSRAMVRKLLTNPVTRGILSALFDGPDAGDILVKRLLRCRRPASQS